MWRRERQTVRCGSWWGACERYTRAWADGRSDGAVRIGVRARAEEERAHVRMMKGVVEGVEMKELKKKRQVEMKEKRGEQDWIGGVASLWIFASALICIPVDRFEW